jgi:hypothetical protein
MLAGENIKKYCMAQQNIVLVYLHREFVDLVYVFTTLYFCLKLSM